MLLFSLYIQLDSMMTQAKSETNDIDRVRSKLMAVDNLRKQVSLFTKKLLEADQVNLNMKTAVLKAQEEFNTARKAKQEVNYSESCSLLSKIYPI